MATKQSHQHSIVCYSESTISIINTIPQFEHVTYICHDSDIDSDGNLKKKHYHVLFRSKSSKTSSAVQKIINNALILSDPEYFNRAEHDTVFCEFVRNTSDALDYLIHKNSPDKFQYAADSICGDIQWWLDNVDDLSAQIAREKKRLDCFFNGFNSG